MFRSEKLLRLCRDIPCQSSLMICDNGPTAAAHSNQQIHGKGIGIKAHDCFVAALCNTCHVAIDNGAVLLRADRITHWRLAWHCTFSILNMTRRIELPSLTEPELLAVNGGIAVMPHNVESVFAFPTVIEDQAWLQFWIDGRARVL